MKNRYFALIVSCYLSAVSLQVLAEKLSTPHFLEVTAGDISYLNKQYIDLGKYEDPGFINLCMSGKSCANRMFFRDDALYVLSQGNAYQVLSLKKRKPTSEDFSTIYFDENSTAPLDYVQLPLSSSALFMSMGLFPLALKIVKRSIFH